MNCPIRTGQGAEYFIAYGARTLSPDAQASLEFHMLECAECRRMAEAQVSVWSALDVWDPVAMPPDFNQQRFDQKLYARIAADEQRPWYRRAFDFNLNWSLRPAMPVAAACTAVIAAFLLRAPLMDQKPSAPTASTSASKSVDIEQVERALDDIDMLKQLGVAPSAGNQKQVRPEPM